MTVQETGFDPVALRSWRKRGAVSARKLACLLGVRVNRLWAWERGDTYPGEVDRARLCELVAGEPPEALCAEPRRRPPPRWTELFPADLRAWRDRHYVSRRSLACAIGVSEVLSMARTRGIPAVVPMPTIRTAFAVAG